MREPTTETGGGTGTSISIITRTLGSPLLAAALESLTRRTRRDFELVLVDITRVFHLRSQATPSGEEGAPSYSAPLRLRTDPDTQIISLAVQDTETGIVSFLNVPLAR